MIVKYICIALAYFVCYTGFCQGLSEGVNSTYKLMEVFDRNGFCVKKKSEIKDRKFRIHIVVRNISDSISYEYTLGKKEYRTFHPIAIFHNGNAIKSFISDGSRGQLGDSGFIITDENYITLEKKFSSHESDSLYVFSVKRLSGFSHMDSLVRYCFSKKRGLIFIAYKSWDTSSKTPFYIYGLKGHKKLNLPSVSLLELLDIQCN